MGCGCGGGKRRIVNSGPGITPQTPGTRRIVQSQSGNRQVMSQQARERLLQNQVNSNNTEAERKRRIQVSLRKRNQGMS